MNTTKRSLRSLVCTLPLLKVFLCVLLVINWHPTAAAWIVITLSSLIAVFAFSTSFLAVFHPHKPFVTRWLKPSIYLGSLCGFSLASTRALLPWEDPSTGEGSPLAVLISIIIYAVFGTIFVSLPLLTCAIQNDGTEQQSISPESK